MEHATGQIRYVRVWCSLWGTLPLCLIACAAEGRHRVLCNVLPDFSEMFCCGIAKSAVCYAVKGKLLRGTRQLVTRQEESVTRHKAGYYAAQGSLLRGTWQAVTRHKAVCYAEEGRLLRGIRQFVTRHGS